MQTVVGIKFGDMDISIFADDVNIPHIISPDNEYSLIHRHKYAEIHVIIEGKAKYLIDDKEYILTAGSAIIIPAKLYHTPVLLEDGFKFTAFQADIDCKDVVYTGLSPQLFDCFVTYIKGNEADNSIVKTVPYFYWLISELFSDTAVTVKSNTDYCYLIFEYISQHYNEDIKLRDLAAEFYISEKQLQRLLKRETGRTFLQELTSYRMRIAEYLIHTSDMNLGEISRRVGYNSYAGFWKAWQKHKNST